MKNDLPDEKFDQLMRQLLNDAALDEPQVSDIADSPTIWWGVQRRITEQRKARSPWPPVGKWTRWLMIGVPTVAAAVLVIAFMLNRAPIVSEDVADVAGIRPQTPIAATREDKTSPPANEVASVPVTSPKIQSKALKVVRIEKAAQLKAKTELTASKRTEIKTDFIALTYARDPDSGQIVRVRVPSSMMVTLGVVATVKKPTDMVDAEVLVGDDGLTRAIRFIR